MEYSTGWRYGVLHVVIKTVFVEYSTGWRYGVLHVAYKWNFMEYLRNSYFLIELHDTCLQVKNSYIKIGFTKNAFSRARKVLETSIFFLHQRYAIL